MRIMAIDFGDARIGIAVSDPGASLAGEVFVITERGFEKAAEKIAQAALERGVGELVVGYPKNMDGSVGPRAEKSEQLAQMLEKKCGLPVTLWDERRTTVSAHEILSGAGKFGKKRKAQIDAVAASLILEGYLAKRRGGI